MTILDTVNLYPEFINPILLIFIVSKLADFNARMELTMGGKRSSLKYINDILKLNMSHWNNMNSFPINQ